MFGDLIIWDLFLPLMGIHIFWLLLIMLLHWYSEVLYKRFLTPVRDDVLNRRLVSDCDRGVLPTRPRNRRGYALLAHTLGKMRSCVTGECSNTEIHTVELKEKYNYTGKIISARKYI